ncbi:hypothetical protein NITMOv2_3076 [Nitrospira moscoviensis]|uniref:Uncharacterized protein n=1 Tax=Nitrospira moscoviensis TaxID=42253 RepID=A0A0K2GEU7_NITMO|nr:hypothetical protein NITMOv2_3076 [Nitrospira moscoviensis]
MVPFRVNPLIKGLYGVASCSHFLVEVADGIVLKTFVHNRYEYTVLNSRGDGGKVNRDGERVRGSEGISCF